MECVFLTMEQACHNLPSIREDLWEWLVGHAGPHSYGWTVGRSNYDDRDGYWFYIKDPQVAMLFKLTWA